MRAYRWAMVAIALGAMSTSAWALGGLATADGSETIRATRVVVARGADDVRIIAQMRYQGTPATAVWLIPLPNFTEPADDGVRGEAFTQAPLDALDAATRPVLDGECDGMPTGAQQEVLQLEQYGPANQMVLPTRFFTAADITMGNLDTYLTDVGVVPDMAMAEAINRVVDENFMLAAVRIDTADLGVNRIDPVVRLRYPLDPGAQIKLGLRMLEPSTGDQPSDLIVWSLDQTRVRSNFNTEELDFAGVSFISPAETNYTQAFDMAVAPRQSQMFVWEYAGPAPDDGFGDATLATLIAETGATFVTRLRARVVKAALRNNVAFTTFREAGAAEVSRQHAVEGFMCGGDPDPEPDPDMGGADDDMGPMSDDMGPVEDDLGGLVADAGDDEDGGDGGGGSSGCAATPGSGHPLPWLFVSLCLLATGLRRRR